MPAGQFAEQARLRRRLAAVRVEAGQRDAHDRDARAIGDDLARGPDRVAECALREAGRERVVGVETRGRLHDVGFDLEDVLQRLVARLSFGGGEAGLAKELLGVGQRDRARSAAGERTQIGASR